MVMMNDDPRARDELTADLGDAARIDDDGLGPDGTQHADADQREHDLADDPQQERQGRWSFLTEMVTLFAVALTIALLIKTFLVQPFWIPSASMENTLLIGDKVMVNKLVYHIRPIGRGDIVVFGGAGSWDAPVAPGPPNHNPVARVYDATLGRLFHAIGGLFSTAPGQVDYIKRVIGVPGDHVRCCDAHGRITVNGVPLSESSYLFPGSKPSVRPFSITVPAGRLWVLGDNRIDSEDSRLHDCAYTDPLVKCQPFDRDGTIPESAVVGRAFMIIWPPSRWRLLNVPATFGQAALSRASAAGRARAAQDTASLSSARLAVAIDRGVPVRPSAPYVPLLGGLAAAVPLTAIERRLRLRFMGRPGARRR
jgi:signal peptidase I